MFYFSASSFILKTYQTEGYLSFLQSGAKWPLNILNETAVWDLAFGYSPEEKTLPGKRVGL